MHLSSCPPRTSCRARLERGRPRLLRPAAPVTLSGACRLEATDSGVYATGMGAGARLWAPAGVRQLGAGEMVLLAGGDTDAAVLPGRS